MATSTIVQRGDVRMKLRAVAPGEVELSLVAMLQFMVTAALFFAPQKQLSGNGTALLTLSNYEGLTPFARGIWGIIFGAAGVLCVRALRRPSVTTRKWAWQLVIPLWACWLSGLIYPLIVGMPTNVITLSAVTVLVAQWLVTRVLVPLDSYWYSRVVPMDGEHQGERQFGVDDPYGSGY